MNENHGFILTSPFVAFPRRIVVSSLDWTNLGAVRILANQPLRKTPHKIGALQLTITKDYTIPTEQEKKSNTKSNERIIRNDSVLSKQNVLLQIADTPDSDTASTKKWDLQSNNPGSEGGIETRMQQAINTAKNINYERSPLSDSTQEGSKDPCTNSGIKQVQVQVQSSSLPARQISPTFKPGDDDDIPSDILLDILSSDTHTMSTIIGDERHVPKHSMEEASSTNNAHITDIIIGDERQYVEENPMEEASLTNTRNANRRRHP